MVLLTACNAPLRHVIAKSGTQSTPMADSVDNGKQQERAAENAHHVLTHRCTSRRYKWLALRHPGTQSPSQIRGLCGWQKIISTMASAKSGQWTMLLQCSSKITEKMLFLFILVTLCHPI
jgi:hypothetical protein